MRRRLHEIESDIERTLKDHEVGTLLTTLDGIGPTTAARLVAELGDIASFRSAAAIASNIGAIPGLRQSGKRQASRAGLTPHGNARLRAALWMPTLTAVSKNSSPPSWAARSRIAAAASSSGSDGAHPVSVGRGGRSSAGPCVRGRQRALALVPLLFAGYGSPKIACAAAR